MGVGGPLRHIGGSAIRIIPMPVFKLVRVYGECLSRFRLRNDAV